MGISEGNHHMLADGDVILFCKITGRAMRAPTFPNGTAR